MSRAAIARPLGAADIYLFALCCLLGAAFGLVMSALSKTAQARRAFRRELWDAGVLLEQADEALRDAELRHAAELRTAAAGA